MTILEVAPLGEHWRRLNENGVKAFPFLRIYFIALANRLNYRNHRKIIVIDGQTAFVGGINVDDRYINKDQQIKRSGVTPIYELMVPAYNIFNICFFVTGTFVQMKNYIRMLIFSPRKMNSARDKKIVQIAASGPDSGAPAILFSILQAIGLATKEILITTPYFIPGDSLVDALRLLP